MSSATKRPASSPKRASKKQKTTTKTRDKQLVTFPRGWDSPAVVISNSKQKLQSNSKPKPTGKATQSKTSKVKPRRVILSSDSEDSQQDVRGDSGDSGDSGDKTSGSSSELGFTFNTTEPDTNESESAPVSTRGSSPPNSIHQSSNSASSKKPAGPPGVTDAEAQQALRELQKKNLSLSEKLKAATVNKQIDDNKANPKVASTETSSKKLDAIAREQGKKFAGLSVMWATGSSIFGWLGEVQSEGGASDAGEDSESDEEEASGDGASGDEAHSGHEDSEHEASGTESSETEANGVEAESNGTEANGTEDGANEKQPANPVDIVDPGIEEYLTDEGQHLLTAAGRTEFATQLAKKFFEALSPNERQLWHKKKFQQEFLQGMSKLRSGLVKGIPENFNFVFGMSVDPLEFRDSENRSQIPEIAKLLDELLFPMAPEEGATPEEEEATLPQRIFRHPSLMKIMQRILLGEGAIWTGKKSPKAHSPYVTKWNVQEVTPPLLLLAATIAFHVLNGTDEMTVGSDTEFYYWKAAAAYLSLKEVRPEEMTDLLKYYNEELGFVKKQTALYTTKQKKTLKALFRK